MMRTRQYHWAMDERSFGCHLNTTGVAKALGESPPAFVRVTRFAVAEMEGMKNEANSVSEIEN
jgi:hypothetical protein